jgi:hypothetical protein
MFGSGQAGLCHVIKENSLYFKGENSQEVGWQIMPGRTMIA